MREQKCTYIIQCRKETNSNGEDQSLEQLYKATRNLEIYKEKEEVDLATSDQKERSLEGGI